MDDWKQYPLQLTLRPWRLVVAKLPVNRTYNRVGEFWCLVHSPNETSLICEEQHAPKEASGMAANWRCLEVGGPLHLEMVGVLSRITAPLAEAEISIFAISSFDTDYVLVREANIQRAIDVLRARNIIIINDLA